MILLNIIKCFTFSISLSIQIDAFFKKITVGNHRILSELANTVFIVVLAAGIFVGGLAFVYACQTVRKKYRETKIKCLKLNL